MRLHYYIGSGNIWGYFILHDFHITNSHGILIWFLLVKIRRILEFIKLGEVRVILR
jgi:hypothetical protein